MRIVMFDFQIQGIPKEVIWYLKLDSIDCYEKPMDVFFGKSYSTSYLKLEARNLYSTFDETKSALTLQVISGVTACTSKSM